MFPSPDTATASAFTTGCSSDPTGALLDSLHTPQWHKISSQALPWVFHSRISDPVWISWSNFTMVQQEKNSLSWCLHRGTLNKRNPGLLYPHSQSLRSCSWVISSCIPPSVHHLAGPQGPIGGHKGSAPVHGLLPQAPTQSSTYSCCCISHCIPQQCGL